MVLYVVQVIERVREKQKERLKKYSRTTQTNGNDRYDEPIMDKFCIAMDNYFTLPKLIKKLRDLQIGVVGTSRFKKNWPPGILRNYDKKEPRRYESQRCGIQQLLLHL